MGDTRETLGKLYEIKSLITVPLSLLSGVKNLGDVHGVLVNEGLSGARKFISGYQSRLERWAISADLTGPVSSPGRIEKGTIEQGKDENLSPLQCWIDDLIRFLDSLRHCFTPDVIDMLAGDRSEEVEIERFRARTYVQVFYETLDRLTSDTDVFICRIAVYPDGVSEPQPESPCPLIYIDPSHPLHHEVIALHDKWLNLKYELEHTELFLILQQEMGAALVRAYAKESGLTSAQELLITARKKVTQILDLIESFRCVAQDNVRLIEAPRLVENSDIVAIINSLERIPCEDVDQDGRVACGSFSRVRCCIASLLEDARKFLYELTLAQNEPDIFLDSATWFSPLNFHESGLRTLIAINEAIMSYWRPEDVVAANSAVSNEGEVRDEGLTPSAIHFGRLKAVESMDIAGVPTKAAPGAEQKKQTVAEELGVTAWHELDVMCTVEGLCIRRKGRLRRRRILSWERLGLATSKKAIRLLLELAQGPAGGIANPSTGAHRRLVQRLNGALGAAIGINGNAVVNEGGIRTLAAFVIAFEECKGNENPSDPEESDQDPQVMEYFQECNKKRYWEDVS